MVQGMLIHAFLTYRLFNRAGHNSCQCQTRDQAKHFRFSSILFLFLVSSFLTGQNAEPIHWSQAGIFVYKNKTRMKSSPGLFAPDGGYCSDIL